MANPWDEFKPAAAPDPWAEFKPVGSTSNPTAAQMASHPMYETAIAHLGQGAVLGGAPNIVGLRAAGAGSTETPEGGMDPLSTVADVATGLWRTLTGDKKAEALRKEAADKERAYLDDLARANPKTAIGAQIVGGAPAAGLISPAAPAATFLGRAGQAAKTGAVLGAVSGAARSESLADVPGNIGKDATVGLVAGPVLQGGIEGVGAGLRAGGNAIRRAVSLTETPQAKLLRAEGVPLTTGQRVGPKSIVAQMESASRDSWGGVGPERKAAEEAWMRVTQNKGVAPGQAVPASTDLESRAGEILKGFDPVYSQVKDVPIGSDVMTALPEMAKMPNRGYDARTANAVSSEIKNALTILGPEPKAPAASGLLDARGNAIPAPPAPPQQATAGDLMKVRSYLRDEIATARTSQDFPRLRLLRKAEEVVTDGIESALPADKVKLLQDADRQYARFLTSLEAAPAGQTTFTPLQYLKRVEKSAGRRAFKTGDAGDLQDLGKAARATFVEAPPTGYTGTILKSIPFGHKLAAPVSSWMNTPGAQRFLFNPPAAAPVSRPMSPQVAAMIQALERQAAAAQLAQAAADSDRTSR